MSTNRKYLFISCHPSYSKRIRSLPYPSEFSYERKVWITGAGNLPYIQEEFKGELYYKTPKWFMDGLKEEPRAKVRFFDEPFSTFA